MTDHFMTDLFMCVIELNDFILLCRIWWYIYEPLYLIRIQILTWILLSSTRFSIYGNDKHYYTEVAHKCHMNHRVLSRIEILFGMPDLACSGSGSNQVLVECTWWILHLEYSAY